MSIVDDVTVLAVGAAAAALEGEQLRAAQVQLQAIIVEPHPPRLLRVGSMP